MKTKLVQFIPVALALLAVGFRYFSNWCIFTNSACYGTTISHISLTITKPLYFFALYFLPIAIVLAFVSREIFKSWIKFSVLAIPLAIIFIVTTPVIDNSLLPFSRDDAARLAGQAFSVASFALIIYKHFSLRRNSGQV